jgi:hypothetical protein
MNNGICHIDPDRMMWFLTFKLSNFKLIILHTFAFMILLGQHNILKATRRTDNGMYLTSELHSGEILLPNRYVPADLNPGDKIQFHKL